MSSFFGSIVALEFWMSAFVLALILSTANRAVTASIGLVFGCHQMALSAMTLTRTSVIWPIGILFGKGFPAAILWRIRTIIVDPAQRRIGRSLMHVGQKIFKPVPSSTNQNASSAIQMIVWRFRVVTPLLHVEPAPVGWGAPVAMFHSRHKTTSLSL